MSFFDKLTKKVEIDEDNWVIIEQLSFGDAKKTRSRSMSMQQGHDGEGEQIIIDPGTVDIESMALSIIDWGGNDFAGRKVTRSNILDLPVQVGEKIIDAINELNTPMTAETKKKSASQPSDFGSTESTLTPQATTSESSG